MDQMIAMVHESSPTLAAGSVNEQLGQFEKLVHAQVDFENPFINGHTFSSIQTLTNRTCQVGLLNLDLATGAWAAAVTGNFAGKVVTVFSNGE